MLEEEQAKAETFKEALFARLDASKVRERRVGCGVMKY